MLITQTPLRPLFAAPLRLHIGQWIARSLDYVALTRPRILMLVLLTAPAGLAMGSAEWPGATVLLGVLLGTALVGGGCGALNAWYESDRDARMARTANRPIPAGRLTPNQALGFGLLVSALGTSVLFGTGGWLPASVGVAAIALYLFVYTAWLKPRTPQAVVIGGVAGAIAPVIADAAVDAAIGPWSLVLFGIVFLWQPPHFWAISLYRKHEYAAAGFPMLPHVAGDRATRRHMLIYGLALLPVTLLPWLGSAVGGAYALTAIVGGGTFVWSVVSAIHLDTQAADRRVFRVSIVYLSALFGVMLAELAAR